MKRFFSIFLLLIMVVVAVRPAISIHYCDGNFVSAEMLGRQKPMDCCAMVVQPKSSDVLNGNPLNRTKGKLLEPSGCCHFQNIKIATDSYSSFKSQLSIKDHGMTLAMPVFVFAFLCQYSDLDGRIPENNGYNDSSGGYIRPYANFLSYICTYRI